MFSVLAAQKFLFGQYPGSFTFRIFDEAGLEWEESLKSMFNRVEELGHRYECNQLSFPISPPDDQGPLDLVSPQISIELVDQ